jgi:hypothetical protein
MAPKRGIGDESRALLPAILDQSRIEQADVILPFPRLNLTGVVSCGKNSATPSRAGDARRSHVRNTPAAVGPGRILCPRCSLVGTKISWAWAGTHARSRRLPW